MVSCQTGFVGLLLNELGPSNLWPQYIVIFSLLYLVPNQGLHSVFYFQHLDFEKSFLDESGVYSIQALNNRLLFSISFPNDTKSFSPNPLVHGHNTSLNLDTRLSFLRVDIERTHGEIRSIFFHICKKDSTKRLLIPRLLRRYLYIYIYSEVVYLGQVASQPCIGGLNSRITGKKKKKKKKENQKVGVIFPCGGGR